MNNQPTDFETRDVNPKKFAAYALIALIVLGAIGLILAITQAYFMRLYTAVMGSLVPPSSTQTASSIDHVFFTMVFTCGILALIVFSCIVFWSIRYRAGSTAPRPRLHPRTGLIELTWSLIPLLLALVIFGWSTKLFFQIAVQPPGTTDVYVRGRQWVWVFQRPGVPDEVGELHVPLDRPIRLIMTSDDVIHSLFIPKLRLKQDVVPGHYTYLWFRPNFPGRYQVLCAQYCGTSHANMTAAIEIMEPKDYSQWLQRGAAPVNMVEEGKVLFTKYACVTCHGQGATIQAPKLDGLFGSEVVLEGGAKIKADEEYIRESILEPRAKIVRGYQPIMPTFKGLISDPELNALVEYIKALQARKQ